MAKYVVYRPAYVGGLYYAPEASVAAPTTIVVPDEVVPSLTWDPVDQAALKAYEGLIEKKFVASEVEGKNPQQAAEIRTRIFKKYRKTLATPPEEKEGPKDDTFSNQDIAAGKGGKIVGRMSDRSPV